MLLNKQCLFSYCGGCRRGGDYVMVMRFGELRHHVGVLPLLVSFLFPFLFLTVRTTEAAVAYRAPELPHGAAEIR